MREFCAIYGIDMFRCRDSKAQGQRHVFFNHENSRMETIETMAYVITEFRIWTIGFCARVVLKTHSHIKSMIFQIILFFCQSICLFSCRFIDVKDYLVYYTTTFTSLTNSKESNDFNY